MIDLENKHLDMVLDILARNIPDCEVWAFGSRVNGTARKYSDLDLAVIARGDIGLERLEELRLKMSESDLPMTVDILDYNAVSEDFRKIIARNREVLRAEKGDALR